MKQLKDWRNNMDFVIAWVDGNDKNWIKDKNKYLPDETQDVGESRYRDWELLKFWFRGVEKFAPWVEHIYFVTYGHIPEWLNVNHPKIKVIRHEEFIPKQYLPTFNSHTIELNLHRIKGLSEEFVYFNDDMFLTSHVKPEYFFKNGIPCDEFILNPVYFAPSSAGAYNGNNLEIINSNFSFKKMKPKYPFWKIYFPSYGIRNLYRNITLSQWPWYPGFLYNHLPTSFLKSTFEEVWHKEEDTLSDTCIDKFRSKRNVNQWLFKYWQLASGNFYPRNPEHGKVFHLKAKTPNKMLHAISYGEYKVICINDTAKTKNFEQQKEAVTNAFLKLLPDKCSFENE